MLPSNGTFEVKYEGGNAILRWSKPAGDYTRQVIEQWANNKRQRRAPETGCQKNPQCVEHEVDKDQTSLTIEVENQDYIFSLVVYDGNIPVSAYQAKGATVSGKCSDVMYGFTLTEKVTYESSNQFYNEYRFV